MNSVIDVISITYSVTRSQLKKTTFVLRKESKNKKNCHKDFGTIS
jgi:hypothetical protein